MNIRERVAAYNAGAYPNDNGFFRFMDLDGKEKWGCQEIVRGDGLRIIPMTNPIWELEVTNPVVTWDERFPPR